MGMRVSLAGLSKNAADCMKQMAEKIHEFTGEDGIDDVGGWEFALRELSKHAQETAKGKHTVEEFAEFYCLTERKES